MTIKQTMPGVDPGANSGFVLWDAAHLLAQLVTSDFALHRIPGLLPSSLAQEGAPPPPPTDLISSMLYDGPRCSERRYELDMAWEKLSRAGLRFGARRSERGFGWRQSCSCNRCETSLLPLMEKNIRTNLRQAQDQIQDTEIAVLELGWRGIRYQDLEKEPLLANHDVILAADTLYGDHVPDFLHAITRLTYRNASTAGSTSLGPMVVILQEQREGAEQTCESLLLMLQAASLKRDDVESGTALSASGHQVPNVFECGMAADIIKVPLALIE